MTGPDLRTYADRFREAEAAGKIRQYLYTYSPRGSNADTRHVIIDADGVERVMRNPDARIFLAEIGA